MEKTILLTLTYLIGLGEVGLAVFFWATHSKSEIRKVMALLALSTGLWVITSGLTSYVAESAITIFYMKLLFAAAVVLVTALVHLALVYPFQLIRLDRFHTWLLYAPTILWCVISFFSGAITTGFTGSADMVGQVHPGNLYSLYNIYTFLLYFVALIVFIWRWKITEGVHKKNLMLIFLSVLIGGIPAIVIDLLMPLFNSGLYPNVDYGAVSTICWLGVTTYIVVKK